MAAPAFVAKPAPAAPTAMLAGLFDPKAMIPSFVLPTFGTEMVTTVASQMISATRAIGEMQAALLDHGVAQLKGAMSELEACARSTSPSEVVAIQSRALRRSADELTDTVKMVSALATKGLVKR
jgi:hypothetical protein